MRRLIDRVDAAFFDQPLRAIVFLDPDVPSGRGASGLLRDFLKQGLVVVILDERRARRLWRDEDVVYGRIVRRWVKRRGRRLRIRNRTIRDIIELVGELAHEGFGLFRRRKIQGQLRLIDCRVYLYIMIDKVERALQDLTISVASARVFTQNYCLSDLCLGSLRRSPNDCGSLIICGKLCRTLDSSHPEERLAFGVAGKPFRQRPHNSYLVLREPGFLSHLPKSCLKRSFTRLRCALGVGPVIAAKVSGGLTQQNAPGVIDQNNAVGLLGVGILLPKT